MIKFTRPIFQAGGGTGVGTLMRHDETGEIKFRQYFEESGFTEVSFDDYFCKEFEMFCRDNALYFYDNLLLKNAGNNMMGYYAEIEEC